MTLESYLSREVQLVLGQEQDLVVLQNNSGVLHDIHGRPVAYGLGARTGQREAPGSSDLIMILAPWGHLIAVELKTQRRGSRLTEQQLSWGAAVARLGATHGVARSVEEARAIVESARRKMRARWGGEMT
jgi:hypothetical protein